MLFAVIDLTAVLVVILSGGLLTGLAALAKFRPERDQVVITTAQGAVVVQSGVIDTLRKELDRVNEELRLCRASFGEERQRRREAERQMREAQGESRGGGSG